MGKVEKPINKIIVRQQWFSILLLFLSTIFFSVISGFIIGSLQPWTNDQSLSTLFFTPIAALLLFFYAIVKDFLIYLCAFFVVLISFKGTKIINYLLLGAICFIAVLSITYNTSPAFSLITQIISKLNVPSWTILPFVVLNIIGYKNSKELVRKFFIICSGIYLILMPLVLNIQNLFIK